MMKIYKFLIFFSILILNNFNTHATRPLEDDDEFIPLEDSSDTSLGKIFEDSQKNKTSDLKKRKGLNFKNREEMNEFLEELLYGDECTQENNPLQKTLPEREERVTIELSDHEQEKQEYEQDLMSQRANLSERSNHDLSQKMIQNSLVISNVMSEELPPETINHYTQTMAYPEMHLGDFDYLLKDFFKGCIRFGQIVGGLMIATPTVLEKQEIAQPSWLWPLAGGIILTSSCYAAKKMDDYDQHILRKLEQKFSGQTVTFRAVPRR